MRLILNRVLVAMYRALCALTLHRWHYYRNAHGGKPLFRSCVHCGKRQTWNYETARSRGRIEWVDYGNVSDHDPDPWESELSKLLRDSPPPTSGVEGRTKPDALAALRLVTDALREALTGGKVKARDAAKALEAADAVLTHGVGEVGRG
jgi:hypothetical protein